MFLGLDIENDGDGERGLLLTFEVIVRGLPQEDPETSPLEPNPVKDPVDGRCDSVGKQEHSP